MAVVQPIKKIRKTKQFYILPLRGYRSLIKLNTYSYKGRWLTALFIVIILASIFTLIGVFTLFK